jgi:hypothetical protein
MTYCAEYRVVNVVHRKELDNCSAFRRNSVGESVTMHVHRCTNS